MRVLKKIKNIISKMNLAQRLVVGIFISIGLYIISYAISDEIDQPFDFKDTWFVWLPAITFAAWLWYELLNFNKD